MPNSQSPTGLGHLIFLAAFENLCQVPVCMFRCSKTLASLSCRVWSVWVRAELQQIPSGDSYLGLNLSWATSAVPSPAKGHLTSFVIRPFCFILLFADLLRGRQKGRAFPYLPLPRRASALLDTTRSDSTVKRTRCAVLFWQIWPIMATGLWDQSSKSGRAKAKPPSKSIALLKHEQSSFPCNSNASALAVPLKIRNCPCSCRAKH